MADIMQIGKALREIRELRGLTQAEVSERFGLALFDYQKLEEDQLAMTFAEVQLFAEMCQVPPSYIFTLGTIPDDSPMPDVTIAIQRLIRASLAAPGPQK